VGFELDEIPVLTRDAKVPLEPGMVVAVEPTFTFPGLGVVGAEDNFVVTEPAAPSSPVHRTL
jgi:Xaa-Pro dipeptidase